MPAASRAAVAALRTQGFFVIEGAVPAAQLVRLGAAYDRCFAAATAPDLRTSSSGGDTRLADFVNREHVFRDLFLLEPVLSTAEACLGPDFKLSSFGGRTVAPGAAAQRLHVDVTPEQDAWPLLGFIVMLDEFRADNGATRFVPGSHHAENVAGVHRGNHRPDDGRYSLACGKPGSVIVYFGSVWHGYSANCSAAPRRSIQGAYISASGTAAVQWSSRMTRRTRRGLSPLARRLLAVR